MSELREGDCPLHRDAHVYEDGEGVLRCKFDYTMNREAPHPKAHWGQAWCMERTIGQPVGLNDYDGRDYEATRIRALVEKRLGLKVPKMPPHPSPYHADRRGTFRRLLDAVRP